MSLHKFKTTVVLPFRALIKPLIVTVRLPGENWETTFELKYDDEIQFGVKDASKHQVIAKKGERVDVAPLTVDSKCFTIIKISSKFRTSSKNLFPKPREDKIKWMFSNASTFIKDNILAKVNYFIFYIKRSNPNLFETSVLRNIGECDFVFYNIEIDNDVIWARGNSTLFAVLGVENRKAKIDATKTLPKEWRILTRACDLVNHGYSLEAFVVGFALLDDSIQEFIKDRLPNLNANESKKILRSVERNRLMIFLEPMMKLVIGSTPIDDTPNCRNDINWLNRKRNNVMHSGKECTSADAQKGLDIILKILLYLKEKGGNFTLPEKLLFWTRYDRTDISFDDRKKKKE